jgi:phosphomannomutase
MNDTLIVSVSGLRGVVGSSLTPAIAVRYAAAFAATLPAGPIVIGRDGRTTGPMLAAALRDSLLAAGRDVIDCGIAATPTVGIVVRTERAAGGIHRGSVQRLPGPPPTSETDSGGKPGSAAATNRPRPPGARIRRPST